MNMINDFIKLGISIYIIGVFTSSSLLILYIAPKYRGRMSDVVFWFACIMTALLSWWSVIDYILEQKNKDDESI